MTIESLRSDLSTMARVGLAKGRRMALNLIAVARKRAQPSHGPTVSQGVGLPQCGGKKLPHREPCRAAGKSPSSHEAHALFLLLLLLLRQQVLIGLAFIWRGRICGGFGIGQLDLEIPDDDDSDAD